VLLKAVCIFSYPYLFLLSAKYEYIWQSNKSISYISHWVICIDFGQQINKQSESSIDKTKGFAANCDWISYPDEQQTKSIGLKEDENDKGSFN